MITSLQPRLHGLTVGSQTDTPRTLDPAHPMAREALYLLTLSGNRQLIGKHLIAIGAVPSEALADILRYALYDKAQAFTLVRTVPENVDTLTAPEQSLIRDLYDLSELLCIEFHDFLRSGPDGSYSWTEAEEDMPF